MIHESPEITERAPVPRGVTRGHAAAAVKLLSSRLAEPWTLTSLAEEVARIVKRPQVACVPAVTFCDRNCADAQLPHSLLM